MTPVTLSRGDIILTRFPFTDLTGASVRPAVVVSHGQIGDDVVLAAISSVVRGASVPTYYTIDLTHPEFSLSGLRVKSVLRMHKLAAVERSVIVRRLGRLGTQVQTEVDRLLRTRIGIVRAQLRYMVLGRQSPQSSEEVMRRILNLPAILFALSTPSIVGAQTSASATHLPRGTATDVANTEIKAAVETTATSAVSDQQLRVVSVNGEYNVGIGVVHRVKTAGRDPGGGIEHSQITEVYHVIEGTGTLVTGGKIENPRETPADSPVVKVLNGPSTGGGPIQNGISRKIGPGDVVIIPPNTPHWFSEITSDQIVYLVVRIDPHKVLPAGYGAK